MYVHVHGARCPDDLMYGSILFIAQRVGDITTSTREFNPNRLLVGEETTNKTTDRNESSVNNSSMQRDKQNIPLPPPPPPPGEDRDSESDMGHKSVHIPLYEGNEDPR